MGQGREAKHQHRAHPGDQAHPGGQAHSGDLAHPGDQAHIYHNQSHSDRVTLMAYQSRWNATDQVPQRAVEREHGGSI